MILKSLLFPATILASKTGFLDHATHQEDYDGEDGIHVITSDQVFFDEFVNKNDLVFVQFRSPVCAKCTQHNGALNIALDEINLLRQAGIIEQKVQMIALDCMAASETCTRYGVKKFPQYSIIRTDGYFGGNFREKVSSKNLVSYLKYQAGPPSKYLDLMSELKDLTDNNHDRAVIVGFFKNKDDKRFPAFQETAKSFRVDDTFRFYHMFHPEVAKRVIGSGDGIAIWREPRFETPNDPRMSVFPHDKFTKGLIERFVLGYGYGPVPQVTLRNRERIGWPHIIFFVHDVDFEFDSEDRENSLAWKERILQLHAEMANENEQGNENWRYSMANYREFSELVESDLQMYKFNINRPRDKAVAHIAAFESHKHRWVCPHTLKLDGDMDKIKYWLKMLYEGRVKMHVKSEAIHADVPADQSQPVSARAFDVLVNKNEDVDIMLLVHANYCTHCRLMKPAWERFAKRMQNEKSVRVMQIEGYRNDLWDERYRPTKGFPTVYLKKKGFNNDPIEYTSESRRAQDFINFLLQQTERDMNILTDEEIGWDRADEIQDKLEKIYTDEIGPLGHMKADMLDQLEETIAEEMAKLRAEVGDDKFQEIENEILRNEQKTIDYYPEERVEHDEL